MKKYQFKKSLLFSTIFRSSDKGGRQFNDVYNAYFLLGERAWPSIMDGYILEASEFHEGIARVRKYTYDWNSTKYVIRKEWCQEVTE